MNNNIEIKFPSIELLRHQKDFWNKWVNNDLKRVILIWHRRAGKDVISFLALIEKALINKGLYWYIFPLYTQARKSFWEAFFDSQLKYIDLIDKRLIKSKNETEMKIELFNDSIIRFIGADKTDSLVGSNPNGVVISEYALQRESLWNQVLEPILERNKGFCIFNSTPRSENHCYDMYNYLKQKQIENDKLYYCDKKTIKDTKIITEEQLKEIRQQGRLEELIQQEYFCSFQGSLVGSYYGNIIDKIKDTNFKENITYNGEDGVHTIWDLGINDSTTIWFVILKREIIEIIDYYENNGYGLGHYSQVILSKQYKYIQHNLPHDGNHRTWTMENKATTIENQLLRLGLNKINIIEKTNNIYSDIQAVREILPICYFDISKTKEGIEALKNYRREYDENRKCFRDIPLHDWASHSADAFRILPKIYKSMISKNIKRQPIKWKGEW